jgi:hypothetical protein
LVLQSERRPKPARAEAASFAGEAVEPAESEGEAAERTARRPKPDKGAPAVH